MAYVSAAEEKTLDNLSVDQDTLNSQRNRHDSKGTKNFK